MVTMSNEKVYLALFLDAPLQSWGYQSRFNRRTTLSYPTRSGIIGMICAAMGKDSSDTAALVELSPLSMRMTVLVFQQGSRLVDFHTVGGGYDRRTQEQYIVHTARGKLRSPEKQTDPTEREYLEDSKFGVILEGPESLLRDIAAALKDPKWGVWLGRKACIPAMPVYQGVFKQEEAAIEYLRHIPGAELQGVMRIVREVSDFSSGTDTLMDLPLDFKNREFAPRRVAVE
jgi:CRISPR system Cascade subunit CasD